MWILGLIPFLLPVFSLPTRDRNRTGLFSRYIFCTVFSLPTRDRNEDLQRLFSQVPPVFSLPTRDRNSACPCIPTCPCISFSAYLRGIETPVSCQLFPHLKTVFSLPTRDRNLFDSFLNFLLFPVFSLPTRDRNLES